MPFAEVNGIKYHYERAGTGCPVILVTGLAGNVSFWSKIVPSLAEHFDVITVDNRGAGSTEYSGEFTIDDMADDIAALAKQLGLEKVHILGWSMGSHIALNFAARYPELTRTLTLVSSYLKRPSRSAYVLRSIGEQYRDGIIGEEVVGTVMNTLLWTESFFRYMESTGRQVKALPIDSKEGMVDQLMAVDNYDIESAAEKVAVPTLSVHGLEDIMTPPVCGDEIAAKIKGCEIIRVPEEGHIIRPDKYIPQFAQFIAKH
ncbi:MAG: alpha/beta hydrolase [archaeon]|nr:alpha/beta hydrolase [archaeon]